MTGDKEVMEVELSTGDDEGRGTELEREGELGWVSIGVMKPT